MKKTICLLLLIAGLFQENLSAQKPKADKRDYYEIKLYRLASNEQVQQVDAFLKNAYLPALHRAGIKKVGVYHPIGNDTAKEKRIFVFIPLPSLKQASTLEDLLVKDVQLQKDGDAYWNAAHNAVLYNRIETILLKAFPLMTTYQEPSLSGNKTDRVYELRSYEGGTERLYRQKVKMFNEGGEIALFKRLNFNAVFYAEVIAGSRMPNLMYMTSFNNMAERDEHWKAFGSSPEWTKLKVMPEYLNTVSRNETILMNPAEFSEL
ncbi:MAG: NIPSNAP family protein [Chitinophagaceae bacterium]|nr:NIPSNAP family protein [Chitinophagaceae bacterium]MCA6453299.1 NIPSNAP family protein [Chitinophagaceae bacterium]MCA6454758.1 NIPSNAP family protein [Chitinophagaceae bacterium]MCA6459449.1 NIPSNAP family protein [Chitinophagaceae bacterium]MCA6464747.1 NIPSNAP family protein [Chitinophagaceae bacterium]